MEKKFNFDKSKKDIFVIFVIVCISFFILSSIDAFEMYTEFTKEHEEYELDEILLLLLVSAFGGIWYSVRRYKEVKELQIKIKNINAELYEDNIKKDDLLIEQTKMASLGEMLQNISHQWRQPLSVISTSASGMKVQKECELLDDSGLERGLDSILANTKYLSETIDNFKNFIKDNHRKLVFKPDENINKSLNILKGSLENSEIKTILDLKAKDEIENYPNELTQIFVNIINNSKDAFVLNDIKDRYIFISSEINDDKLYIKIRDNANGIPKNIINKIFEPYFTTKHQSKGTGLGLYMSYKMVVEKMEGQISVENINFEYEGRSFIGAEFQIVLPVK